MKHFYHIMFDTDLYKVLYGMQNIPCACTGCVEKLSNPLLTNLDKTLQPRYAIKLETCKYSSILRGYNKLYICQIDFFLKKQQTQIRWGLNMSLSCMA